MRSRQWLAIAATGALALGVTACGSSNKSSSSSSSSTSSGSATSTPASSSGGGGSSRNLAGAGSTLVAPLVSQWESDYSKRAGVTVTYGGIGSGGGIAQITAKTVDFGASDAPLSTDQASAARDVIQIPWALAATVVAYNVKGVSNNLRLSGPLLADMYLGRITSWNDPAIARLNPGVTLPSTKVTPVYRSDGSGDTYALTDFLSKISPDWRSRVGNGTQVQFPSGVGGRGNDGVGGVLSRTDGAIAYIAISYVLANRFNYADVQNAAGRFPAPSISSISAAASAVTTVPADNRISITNPPASAADAYPISTFTYALVPTTSSKGATLRAFLTYAIGAGQSFGARLEFAPLPAAVLAADKASIAKIGG